MSEFQFQKSQRVIVPADIAGADNVQAVIVANSVRLGYEPSYTVQWPSSDTVGEAGFMMLIERVVGEAALVKAQPPKMITKAEADDLREELDLERAHRAAARKQKPAKAKSKSRRKR